MSAEIVDDALNEVLDIVQRQKRAQITRANKKKLEVARRVAKGRMASTKNLKKRAYAQARKIVRRKFAGKRGEEYDSLGPAEKVQIDKAVAGKLKIIKKIAARLLPRIQQAEAKRLSSFTKGKQLQNLGAKESGPMNEETNKKFGDKFKGKKEQKKVASQIKMYNKFSEEVARESGAYKALAKKAASYEIDLETLGEVFDRGLASWTEDVSVSRQQYAFARVNSYINQGKSYFNEDADLHEGTNKPYVKKTKGLSGQDSWKAMNKHGKTKWFNSPDSAHTHAGINKPVNEISVNTLQSYKDKADNRDTTLATNKIRAANKAKDFYTSSGRITSNGPKVAASNPKKAPKKNSGRQSIHDHVEIDEVLGPENDIGTDALVRKVRKVTPGQEDAQTHENCGTDACCQNCPTAVKEAASVITNTADTKRVIAKSPSGKVVWRNVRTSRDIIKD